MAFGLLAEQLWVAMAAGAPAAPATRASSTDAGVTAEGAAPGARTGALPDAGPNAATPDAATGSPNAASPGAGAGFVPATRGVSLKRCLELAERNHPTSGRRARGFA